MEFIKLQRLCRKVRDLVIDSGKENDKPSKNNATPVLKNVVALALIFLSPSLGGIEVSAENTAQVRAKTGTSLRLYQ
jgi:hypothetical protein